MVPADRAELRSARSAQVLVRPEWGRLGGPLPGRVVAVRYRGSDTDYRLDTPVGLVEVRERGVPHADVGDARGWTIDRAWLLPGSPAGTTADDSPREPPTTARASASAASPTT
jgi:hypothetical protein